MLALDALLAASVLLPAATQVAAPKAFGSIWATDRTNGAAYRVEFRTFTSANRAASIMATLHVEDDGRFHRILLDRERGLYYGYDAQMKKDPAQPRYTLSIGPLQASVDQRFRDEEWPALCHDCAPPHAIATATQRFPPPQTMSEGDTLSIDLLADETGGEVITERIQVLSTAMPTTDPTPQAPRDLALDDILLHIVNGVLYVDGAEAYPGKGRMGLSDHIIWTSLPDRGRAFVSLKPQPGYDFKKIGAACENKITFTLDGRRYEWVSDTAIIRAGYSKWVVKAPDSLFPSRPAVSSWFVWVLHDPSFRPWTPGDHEGGAGAIGERLKIQPAPSPASTPSPATTRP